MTANPDGFKSPWQHTGHVGTHESYALSCDEYSRLVARAEGRCDRCGKVELSLLIEHDHAHPYGRRAVRGMTCSQCNQLIALVDSGKRPIDDLTAHYFANAFYLCLPQRRGPRARDYYVGRTALRVQVDTETLDAAWRVIRRTGTTMEAVIEATLRQFADDPGATYEFLREKWNSRWPVWVRQ